MTCKTKLSGRIFFLVPDNSKQQTTNNNVRIEEGNNIFDDRKLNRYLHLHKHDVFIFFLSKIE